MSSARVLLEAVLAASYTSRAIPLNDSAVKPPRSRARLEPDTAAALGAAALLVLRGAAGALS